MRTYIDPNQILTETAAQPAQAKKSAGYEHTSRALAGLRAGAAQIRDAAIQREAVIDKDGAGELAGMEEPEEITQGYFEDPDLEGAAEPGIPVQGRFTAQLAESDEDEELLQGMAALQRLEAEEDETLQEKAASSAAQSTADGTKTVVPEGGGAASGNGLPAQLRAGAEALSGLSLADVSVRYNSPEPARIQAHAYTRGNDIHVGPGQEKHLPHEAWHAVQQKQGRVRPTRQLKSEASGQPGGGVSINDDAGLEKEADVMGARALVAQAAETQGLKAGVSQSYATLQAKIVLAPNPLARLSVDDKKTLGLGEEWSEQDESTIAKFVVARLVPFGIDPKRVRDDVLGTKPELVRKCANEKEENLQPAAVTEGDQETPHSPMHTSIMQSLTESGLIELVTQWDAVPQTYNYKVAPKQDDVAAEQGKTVTEQAEAAVTPGKRTGKRRKPAVTPGKPAAKVYESILKDSMKYFLHRAFGWITIGAGAYMTGDVPGLSAALWTKPNLTVKLLMGPQGEGKPGHSIITSNSDGVQLPTSLRIPKQEAAEAGLTHGTVVFSDISLKSHFKGTSDKYALTYDSSRAENKKPWNYHVGYSTSITAKNYAASPENRATMREHLVEVTSDMEVKVSEIKNRIVENNGIESKNCVILWGRKSGAQGGAHPENDSPNVLIIQLANFIEENYKDYAVLFAGDDDEELRQLWAGLQGESRFVMLGKFWEATKPWSDPDSPNLLRDMNAQRLLMELFAKKHKAVSIGMRSGVLDGLALVGMPVIYMDHYMDQHPERPEKLAGKAGKPRATAEKWSDADEVGKDVKGKVPHYKRFALKFDFHKGEVKKIVKACKNTSTLLTKKKIQLEEKSPEVSEAFDAVKSIVLNPSSRWEDMVCYCTSWDKIKAVQKNVTFPDGKQVQISHIQLSADELMLFAEKGESLLSADFMLLEEEKPKLKALIDYLITRAPNAGGEEAPLASQET